ncbi:MAG: type II secretion system F family protein [Alphaproteobacteria bacterium]|nr:type II secretion system F family protein [Alphaproteobacteria bacterium]
MDLVETFTSTTFLTALFAAVAAGAVVFTFGAQFFDKTDAKQRIKRVALEREKLRTEEMSRLRGAEANKPSIRGGREAKAVVTSIVERFDLQKAFADENTQNLLTQAGYRGQGPLTTYVFLRFVTPLGLLLIALLYLAVLVPGDRPLFLNVLYSVAIGLLGSYLPLLLLRNKIQKRQASIRRAWPDCLDLLLLCVESGMSIEHAFKRVAKEIGVQSIPLAEELTLTNAELSFLEDRTRAYDNLGKRTGLDGVRAVMTALIQSERYGTSVGQSLRIMAEEGREARMMEAEKKAAALPPKLTVPLILFFLPVLFIVIISPALIKIFSQNLNFGI